MSQVARALSQSGGPAAYARAYLDIVRGVLGALDPEALGAAIGMLAAARRAGATVWICGNGGSAATASHLANDLGALAAPPVLRVACLCDNVAVLTARGNDDGFEAIFSRQLTGRVAPGDLLVAISVSGRSPNVLAAAAVAQAAGARVLGLCGFAGGALAEVADLALTAPAEAGDYGPVEGVHAVICHLLANALMADRP